MSGWLAMKRIASQMNYTIHNVSPIISKVHLPGGFPYISFDNKVGRISPRTLFKAVEEFGVLTLWPKEGESIMQMDKILQDYLIYIAKVNMHIFPEVYCLDTPKYPLIFTQSLKYLGTSSVVFQGVISCPEVNTPYVVFDVFQVFLDPNTLLPAKLPDWFTEQYSVDNERPARKTESMRPSSCLRHDVIVHPDDCDVQHHTSFANYGIFCYRACNVFVRKSLYRNINQKSIENGVKLFDISFKKESYEFDNLSVYSWEDDVTTNKVHFEIENHLKEICCQVRFEFYTGVPDVLSKSIKVTPKL